MKKIAKIVLSGGPCAGKTSALSAVKEEFESMGYTVLTIAETATEMIKGGLAPWTCGVPADFQKLRLELQLEKESVYERAAATMGAEKILIVCDRAALDSKCYMTDETFREALFALGKSEIELRDSYDAVFHLVTAAKGDVSHYVTGEGTGRGEDAERSAHLDDLVISAWCGHPHLRLIGCYDCFEDKMKRLNKEIASFLGEPEPLEIERKYLIEYPDLSMLSSDPFCRKTQIEQIYFAGGQGRIRRRGENGAYLYFHTVKRGISPVKRIEIERRITAEEYEELKRYADPERKTLTKDRYCLVYKEQYFEIDVYPFWDDKALMEIELSDESDPVELPPFIKVIREVSGEEEYKNSSIAKRI